jgi:hypothetical protein
LFEISDFEFRISAPPAPLNRAQPLAVAGELDQPTPVKLS